MSSNPIRLFVAIIVIIAVLLFMLSVKGSVKSEVSYPFMVPNSSVEQVSANTNTPTLWNFENWGTNTASFDYLAEGHTGKQSLQTTITSYTSGDAKWYFTPQLVLPGQQYTFTDYYKSDVTSRVVVAFERKDTSLVYKELKNAPASSTWKQYQDSFTVPPEAKTMTVFHLLSAKGFLITDDYQIRNYVLEGFKRGLVSIAWDDGVASQYTKGFPIHKEYNLPGTFFLVSDSLNKEYYMTTDQAKELQRSGSQLGSHTVTHPRLSQLKLDDINHELKQSKVDLQATFRTSFDDFVSPYGDYNDQVLTEIKKYYRSHRSVEAGFNAKNNFDIYNMYVQNVHTGTPTSQVEAWVEKAKTDKTWLILVYHQVDNPGDSYNVSSDDLDKQFRFIRDSGIQVVTFDQAIKEIVPQITEK